MDEDPTEEDIWNSTKFSTQRVYKQTIKLAILSFFTFLPALYLSFMPFFTETCGIGYFQYDSSQSGFFSFVEQNVCGLCLTDNCLFCDVSQGT